MDMNMNIEKEGTTVINITGNIIVHQAPSQKKKTNWLGAIGSLASIASLFR